MIKKKPNGNDTSFFSAWKCYEQSTGPHFIQIKKKPEIIFSDRMICLIEIL